jgi:hypothetical protein
MYSKPTPFRGLNIILLAVASLSAAAAQASAARDRSTPASGALLSARIMFDLYSKDHNIPMASGGFVLSHLLTGCR